MASAFSTGMLKIGASGLENVSDHVHLEPVSGADMPKTGASATPMLWLGLLLLAGTGLAVNTVFRRKRQNG